MSQNYLAIDYGTKRIGLAYGDELGIAMPISAILSLDEAERIADIKKVVVQRRISIFVVGYPVNMDGSFGYKTKEVDAFIAILEQAFPEITIVRVDETLSSYEAESNSSHSKKNRGLKHQKQFRRSGEIDSRAASVFLQDYFNSQGIGADNLYDEFE